MNHACIVYVFSNSKRFPFEMLRNHFFKTHVYNRGALYCRLALLELLTKIASETIVQPWGEQRKIEKGKKCAPQQLVTEVTCNPVKFPLLIKFCLKNQNNC